MKKIEIPISDEVLEDFMESLTLEDMMKVVYTLIDRLREMTLGEEHRPGPESQEILMLQLLLGVAGAYEQGHRHMENLRDVMFVYIFKALTGEEIDPTRN